jgi:hypothetical protein
MFAHRDRRRHRNEETVGADRRDRRVGMVREAGGDGASSLWEAARIPPGCVSN